MRRPSAWWVNGLALCGLWCGASMAFAQVASNTATALVFDGVTVVDVAKGTLIPGQRVVVAGTRIRAVGSERRIPLPSGAQVIDARNKYLIPGLWDMHTHPSYSTLMYPLFIANGITGIRSAIDATPLQDQVQRWHAILAGTMVGPPRQLLAGIPINRFYPGPFGPGLDGPARLARILDSLKAAGATFLKMYPLAFDLAAGARRAGLPFGGHVPEDISAIEASDSGMNIVDHALYSQVHPPCLGDARSLERCRPVAETFRKNGTWLIPTLAIQAKVNQATRYLASSRSVFMRLDALSNTPWTDTSVLQGTWLRASTGPGTAENGARVARDSVPADTVHYLDLVQRLGLPVLAGTDTGFEGAIVPGFSLHAELAMSVAEGLTPVNALQSATLNPAKLLHGTDSLGTVAPGKLADLVLLDANPLADISNTTAIRAVVANGRYFDRAALDQLLAQAQSRR